jgi:hypothetical protein
LLKERLKQLEQRVAEQGRNEKQTQEKLRQAAAQPAPVPEACLPSDPRLYSLKGSPLHLGGFLALESVTRSPFMGADIGSPPYTNIPFDFVPSSHSNEFRFSARQSRVSALMQGDVDPATHLAGYAELDFLGAGQTANSNESNSYNPRIRHLYATVDNDYFGAHLLAGQEWSLATMNTKGIMPRQEDIPLTIDAQYVPGFVWSRQPQIRVVKDFDQTLWFALSAENPATTIGGTAPVLPDGGVIVNGVVSAVPAPGFPQTGVVGGSLFNSLNAINFTQMPDIIGKVAWEPTIADRTIHMEAFGIFRQFTNRVIFPFGSAAFPFGTGFLTKPREKGSAARSSCRFFQRCWRCNSPA